MQQLINRIFSRSYYNTEGLLLSLTRVMANNIDLEYMVDQILLILTTEMRITKASFVIVDNNKITNVHNVGYKNNELTDVQLEALFHRYLFFGKRIIFQELKDGSLKELFRKLNINIAIPIKFEDKVVAILILGSRTLGKAYSKKDIDLLDIFAQEAGIAIQNAKTYKKMMQLSQELEKKVEERTRELKKSQEMELQKAHLATRLKDEFVFIAAHELRTPVTAIRGFLELVSESKKNFPKDVKEHLKAINSASNNLSQLINDLLEISRSDAGTMKVNVEPIDIIPIVNEVINELAPLTDPKNIKIIMQGQKSLPPVLADSKKIREAITNLLSNAIKYNKGRGKIYITFLSLDGEVMVEFSDTGYGIAKEEQKKIFQKFFRARTKGTQEVLGTGLGLFITRMLVEKMGGKVSFSSVKEKGSTFVFSLPTSDKS